MSEAGPVLAYGGQAVIEGVMMRGPRHFAVACRRPNGEIVVKEERVPAVFTRYAWAKLPIIRGSFALADALVLGMKSLVFSANLVAADMAAEGKSQRIAPDPGVSPEKAAATQITGIAVGGSAVMGIVIGIGIFLLLPSLVAGWLGPILHPAPWALNLIEGFLRIGVLLGYIAAIGRMKEVRRLFQYHGAEHKAINALEREGELDVDVALAQSTIHPRCGTNFVLTVLVIKILVFSLFGWPELWLRLTLRVLCLPLVAGIAYEVLRLAGKYRGAILLQVLILPGLLTQKLTTREPDRSMVEVAVAALGSVTARESLPDPVSPRVREPAAATV